jgi:NAD(P)H-nitrite reductase large subunit
MQTIPFKTNFFADADKSARSAALEGDHHADAVIVGGGLVGLSRAYTLRQGVLPNSHRHRHRRPKRYC